MAMEMHVCSERRLNSMAEWQRAVDLEGYPLKFAPGIRLEAVNGFLPCRLRERETGFECHHEDARLTMENYGQDIIHSQWKYALGFAGEGISQNCKQLGSLPRPMRGRQMASCSIRRQGGVIRRSRL